MVGEVQGIIERKRSVGIRVSAFLVTIRNRDTMEQERVAVSELNKYFFENLK
jgi:hypothetical protein